MLTENYYEHIESHREKFEAFLRARPDAYPKFCQIVEQLMARRMKHSSADFVCHIMRWNSIIDGRPEDIFKINNNHARFFRERWQKDHPDDIDFFFSRESKSA